MFIKSIISCLVFWMLLSTPGIAQKQVIDIQRIEPSFWWVGMKNPELQVLIYGKNIAAATASLKYEGVEITRIDKTENPNYQFLYLSVQPTAKAGIVPITFQWEKKKRIVNYELKNRLKPGDQFKGFDPSDVIYLIMPDRFANGDETNDWLGMVEKPNRQEPFGRHGGDLKGIENHLDYIQDLGATALWLNPVQENNQPVASYHGYAITDFYKVDPRLGTNESYVNLVKKCHDKGMKVVMDMVFNHAGSENWFVKDLPAKDWIHQFPEYTSSNYRLAASVDPYASKFDTDKLLQGWFDRSMPDLNQHNPHLATYLIQNSMWWVEYAQLDGIRMDTHPYPYKDFMAKWCKVMKEEYPNLNIVGEVWESPVLLTSYFQANSKNRDGYAGNLPSVTDFPLCFAFGKAFNEKDGWDEGLARIYYVLLQDVAYSNPLNNVIFLDNHDLSRFATVVKGDINKQKMGLAALLTLRGIPQLFYGAELGMPGDASNHGTLRADMPGGWKADATNAFSETGRTPEQNELFNYLKTLLNWRKKTSVVHTGKFMHFIPENGLYVYFRYNDSESVMVILNNNEESKTLDTKRFQERLKGFSSGKNVVSNESITNLQNLSLPAKSATIIELIK
ncbi:MAG: glycoside hydrolase family 13 protein [Cyclobacteriaceae bacterium]